MVTEPIKADEEMDLEELVVFRMELNNFPDI